jgi:hypothetical protein
MNTSEIKKSLHNYIEMIEDESQLQMLNDTVEVYATKKQADILDLLTNEQLQRLEQSSQQVDEGKVISHKEVKNNITAMAYE